MLNDSVKHRLGSDSLIVRVWRTRRSDLDPSGVPIHNNKLYQPISQPAITNTMAPKKKGNKKGNDDWETELGETPDQVASAAQQTVETETAQESRETETAHQPQEDGLNGGGGGLLAALRKNKSKKQKKGKHVEEDYLEGEEPNGANGHTQANGIMDLAAKAPEEANADDMFDTQLTKVKGGKGKQGKTDEEANESTDGDEGGGMKSKKEKEREKKEREKQRKKEQVRFHGSFLGLTCGISSLTYMYRRRKRKQSLQRPRPKQSLSRRSQKPSLSPRQPQRLAKARRNYHPTSQHCRSSKSC